MGFGPFGGPPGQDFTLKKSYIRYARYIVDPKQPFALHPALHALRGFRPHLSRILLFNDLAHFLKVPCVTPPCIPLPSPPYFFAIYTDHTPAFHFLMTCDGDYLFW